MRALVVATTAFLVGCVATYLGAYSRLRNVYPLVTIALGIATAVLATRLAATRLRRRGRATR